MERLSELLAKATPGPWAYDTSEPDPMFTPNWHIYPEADCEYSIAEVNGQVNGRNEAALITEAVNALPTLLAALSASSGAPNADAIERLRIMAKQRSSAEMDSEDLENADWQGAYDWFCAESREIFASLSHGSPVQGERQEEGASPVGDRAAGLRPQPPAASSQSSIPSATALGWRPHLDFTGDDMCVGKFRDHEEELAAVRRGTIEECARVAEEEREGRLVQKSNANAFNDKKAARDYETMAIACTHVATAIRNLAKDGA